MRDGGHDYLFGLGTVNDSGRFQYRSWWAVDASDEQSAFEQLMDAISAARAVEPGLHVHHFAPYEATAFKRLAGRATSPRCAGRAVAKQMPGRLHAVARQAVRAGVESYSIGELEQHAGRATDSCVWLPVTESRSRWRLEAPIPPPSSGHAPHRRGIQS